MLLPQDLRIVSRHILNLEEKWHETPKESWGLKTGLESLDRLTGGLQPGMTILGARTSHGKTALAVQIAAQVAFDILDVKGEEAVLLFSPEMTPAQIAMRFASSWSGIPSLRIRRGTASDEDREPWRNAAAQFALLAPYLRLYAGNALTLEEVEEALTELKIDGKNAKLVVIDYLQRVLPARVKEFGNYQTISTVATTLKYLSNEAGIPFLVAAQLNRNVVRDSQTSKEDRFPSLIDLEGSGAIEQNADAVLLMHRPPEPTVEEEAGGQEARIELAKNRDGPVGLTKLIYWPHIARFDDPSKVRVTLDG